MNRLIIAFAALAATTLAATAAEKTFKPNDQGHIEFDTPGGNLCCSYIDKVTYYPEGGEGPQLTCTRMNPVYWIVHLKPDGTQKVNKDPGEVPGCGYGEPLGNVLSYGDTTKIGRYSCSMERNGITCKAGSKGFRLSRKGLFKAK